jgi:GTPase SAR1 family protein
LILIVLSLAFTDLRIFHSLHLKLNPHQITRSYYKGANGIILVYDVTKRESFSNVGYWIRNIQEAVTAENMPAIILVANKTDLPGEVAAEDGAAKAEEHGIKFFECSAKSGVNVNDGMTECATDALQRKLIAAGIIPNPEDATGKKKCVVQ